jgi:hypothetical protein
LNEDSKNMQLLTCSIHEQIYRYSFHIHIQLVLHIRLQQISMNCLYYVVIVSYLVDTSAYLTPILEDLGDSCQKTCRLLQILTA